MIDHPQFDPVFDFMEREGMRLMGHLGEPRNCWLPLEEMTVKNDRRYFQNNLNTTCIYTPKCRVMKSNWRLVTGCLGNIQTYLSWALILEVLSGVWMLFARFLEEHPSAVVDTAARMGQLEYQSQRDWKKVRDFMLKYQDRILYVPMVVFRPQVRLLQHSSKCKSDGNRIGFTWLPARSSPCLSWTFQSRDCTTSFCAGQNLPRECEATFSYSLDGVKDLALRAPIVSALMEVGSRPGPFLVGAPPLWALGCDEPYRCLDSAAVVHFGK